MKAFVIWLLLFCSCVCCAQRAHIAVGVYPGVELLNVIQTLADTSKGTRSVYKQDIIQYFGAYRDHPAVQMARSLPLINCDFPVRLSWQFYDFPNAKLEPPDTLGGYEPWFKKAQVQAYFRACLRFYKDTHFWLFYQQHEAEYQRWVASFNRNLYEQRMLSTLDSFYRIRPAKKIMINLGPVNCGSFAVPEMGVFNPHFKNTTVIMVAYGSIIGRKDAIGTHPDFFAPVWATQLVWHEMGHAYLGPLFEANAKQVSALKPIFDRDSSMQKAAGKMGWPVYLNENVTQAVTSLLRIKNGKNDREAEMKRIADGKFYLLTPAIMALIEKDYLSGSRYKNFADYFPVLLAELRQQMATN